MLSFQCNTIKFYESSPIKNEGSPLLAQNEVRADIFSGSLAVFQSERVASAGGRKGGLGGIPPALQILGEICSNFFVKRPQIVNRQRCARPAKRGRGERIKASQRDKFEAAAES